MAAPTAIIKGTTTIVWGTTTKLGTPSAAVVEAISVTPKNGEPIADIENGDGASVVAVLLDDGFDAKVTCLYDTALTWPAVGDTVTLSLPKYGAVGGATSYNCILGGTPKPDLARKREATIELHLRYRAGVLA